MEKDLAGFVLRAGSSWYDGSNCGSRTRGGHADRSVVSVYAGCRVFSKNYK